MCIERSMALGDSLFLFHRILKESKNSPDNNVLRGHNKKKAEPQFIGTLAFWSIRPQFDKIPMKYLVVCKRVVSNCLVSIVLWTGASVGWVTRGDVGSLQGWQESQQLPTPAEGEPGYPLSAPTQCTQLCLAKHTLAQEGGQRWQPLSLLWEKLWLGWPSPVSPAPIPTQLPTTSLPHPTPRQLLSASTEVLFVILCHFHHERKQRKSMEICDCVFMC